MTNAKKQPSVRDRLKARARPTSRFTICDDPKVKENLDRARYALALAESQADTTGEDGAKAVEAAQKKADEAQAAYDAEAIVLTFQALDRPAFEALKRAHPPTEAEAEEGAQFNAETLAPELIAAASCDDITVDEAREYLDTWSTGEAIALYTAAYSIQSETSRVDVGKG
ncbi:hypothetical protein [Streptomyces sp. t39]|uniref:hypothetical protein n=1 Tax=Streptomyces sp. t39 TaxID=1828156 RepID=UPI0011CE9A99|nr:hypothetical protein [Streptomyces sp. t39]TXS39691.1 hypothetical protein EAO77_36095 [Streptomyces sp. t39]